MNLIGIAFLVSYYPFFYYVLKKSFEEINKKEKIKRIKNVKNPLWVGQ